MTLKFLLGTLTLFFKAFFLHINLKTNIPRVDMKTPSYAQQKKKKSFSNWLMLHFSHGFTPKALVSFFSHPLLLFASPQLINKFYLLLLLFWGKWRQSCCYFPARIVLIASLSLSSVLLSYSGHLPEILPCPLT